jgi:biotin synthase
MMSATCTFEVDPTMRVAAGRPADCEQAKTMKRDEILAWLREEDEERLNVLWERADYVRRDHVGDEVRLRGLIEISNHCVQQCGYCGIRFGNRSLQRYRMTDDEIMSCVRTAQGFGYGTVVLQAGEDYGITAERLAGIIRRIKAESDLAVTLGMGERAERELELWRRAGADRYLLKFETSDPILYRLIHPPLPGRPSDRVALLRQLWALGYETGGGVMVGIPGQTFASLADDIALFRALDLDMIGVGPYIPHPATPLGTGEWRRSVPASEQVPNSDSLTYRVLALTRLVCPEANIPATTALATVNAASGRITALSRGANVIMPDLTPPPYRAMYEIYPARAYSDKNAHELHSMLLEQLHSIDRYPGRGPGGRVRRTTNRAGILQRRGSNGI